MSTMFRDISSVDAMPSQIEPPSRMFGLSSGKTAFRPSLISQDSSRQNMQFASSNNLDYMSDQRHRTSILQNPSLGFQSFGLQSRNISSHSTMIPEGSFRVNQEIQHRNTNTSTMIPEGSFRLNQEMQQRNTSTMMPERSFRLNQEMQQRNTNTSTISKSFWPAVRNTTLTTGLQMQDSVRYNDDIVDNDGFRKPSTLRIIRGRNPTYSSRLFQTQNTDRHYKDLSNINGFNVSHISRRGMDTLSESRLQLRTRSNWMDNQSLSGSVISVVSMKAQFINLLENLHHSILSIGPRFNADAVRMEFDKAKQGLENISEMSFADPTIKPADTASVVSMPSKYICPPINGETTTTGATLDGASLNLKSAKALLKTLTSATNNQKRKFELSTHVEEDECINGETNNSQGNESEDEEVSSLFFTKTRKCNSKRTTTRMKIKAPPQVKKNLLPKGAKMVINLKQWYPIAVGSDLAFCGVDEKGASVKTDPVKKRLSNRKVELVTGTDCNLVGSPSAMVTVLPEKIMMRLKNGLTDRWRVLQKELLNCQTAEGETKKRTSKSPKVKRTSKSPKVKSPESEKRPKGRRGRPKTESSKKPRVISTPKKKGRDSQTRSGRAVKRPGMFWLSNGSKEISTTSILSEATAEELPKKKPRKSSEGSPAKKSRKSRSVSPSKKYKKSPEKSPNRKASPRKYKKANEESQSKKQKTDEDTPTKNYKKMSAESPSRKGKTTEITSTTPRKYKNESPNKRQKTLHEDTPTNKHKKVGKASPKRRGRTLALRSPKKYKTTKKESPTKKYTRGKRESLSRKIETSEVASPEKSKAADNESNKSKRKSPKVKSPKKKLEESKQEVEVHSSTEDAKRQNRNRYQRGKRKRETTGDADVVESKKSKVEKKIESTVKSTESVTKGGKKTKTGLTLSYHSPKSKGKKPSSTKSKKETVKKNTVNELESSNIATEFAEFEKNFEFKLDDIEIPEIANISGNPQLSRSQLRLVSMETPPLKYFNSNLKLLGSTTPMRSPDWCISQRTESEVKQFQKRREEAFKKRIKMNVKKTVITEKHGQNKDVKKVMEWVSEKAVRSPQWTSKVLQYVIPSRKQLEEQEDDEDVETEFF